MTTLYARSDVATVSVGPTGHTHTKKGSGQFTVNCAECEPTLRQLGWVQDPHQVELTPDEIWESENARDEIARFQQQAVAAAAREASSAVRASKPR